MKQIQPIIILDEHPNWLEPLYMALTNRGVLYKKIDTSTASFDPAEKEKNTLYVNRFSPSAAKRGHDRSAGFVLNYLSHLESQKKRIINGVNTVLLETSKARQASLLESLHIPYPKSIVVNDQQKILDYLDDFIFPVVVKPNCGGSGMGVRKFETKKALEDAVKDTELEPSNDGVLILQEFIQPQEGFVVRVETINKKVIYGMKVFTQDTFNLCPSESCDLQRNLSSSDMGYCVATPKENVTFALYPNLPNDVVKAVENIVAEAGLETAGIEYVVDRKGKWYIYDINALSILRGTLKEEYGIDGWGMLADYIVQEYQKVIHYD